MMPMYEFQLFELHLEGIIGDIAWGRNIGAGEYQDPAWDMDWQADKDSRLNGPSWLTLREKDGTWPKQDI